MTVEPQDGADLPPHIDKIARHVLGAPNKAMSSAAQWRYGTQGSLSVEMAGDKQGSWFDHERQRGGTAWSLMTVHAGLSPADASAVLTDLGIRERPAQPHTNGAAPRPRIVATYDYHDPAGALAYQVCRLEPKTFRQRRPDPTGGDWIWSTKGIELYPYRLRELLNADLEARVYIVEGEKDADRLAEEGLIATTNPGGAGKWLPAFAAWLQDRDCIIIPDNDAPGRDHAQAVAKAVSAAAASVRIVELPDLPPKGDITDWLTSGASITDLEILARSAPPWAPQKANGNGLSHDHLAPESTAPQDREQEPLPCVTEPSTLSGVEIPARRWVVPGWLPWGAVTGIYGDGGTGKSLIAQQLIACCATGRSWMGHDVAPIKAFGLFCEDEEDELRRRQRSINQSLDLDWPDLENMGWVSRFGSDNLLMTFDNGRGQLTPLWHQVRAECLRRGAQLLILDTAADLFGGNENYRGEVRQFIQVACGGLARDIDGAVLLCAHPSASGLQSGRGDGGSTQWSNAMRSRWFLHRPEQEGTPAEGDDDRRILERMKANYAGAGLKLDLTWRDGVFELENPTSGLTTRIEGTLAERRFMEKLGECERQGRPVSDAARAGNYAPKQFSQMGGGKVKDLAVAMESLFAKKTIRMIYYGRKGDERRRIQASPEPAIEPETNPDTHEDLSC